MRKAYLSGYIKKNIVGFSIKYMKESKNPPSRRIQEIE